MRTRCLHNLCLPAFLAVSSLLGAGCIPIDVTADLPSFDTPFNFPLPPGVPIDIDLDIPDIQICEHVSQDTVLDYVRTVPLGSLVVGLFKNCIHIEEITIVRSVMEVVTPGNGTFTGLTEFSFFLGEQPLLTATDEAGIEDKRIVLTTDAPVNLKGLIDGCPSAAASIRAQVEGQVPATPPTKWRNTITAHIKGHIGLF
ncbi:MAG: hypothetical protein KA184_12340 [Candidatus Hydrogenedentes bacterium]|nr:hypothetical protein [Candidatus Hydrogenedentota bacterium]